MSGCSWLEHDPRFVYYCYDRHGALLYIGHSRTPATRVQSHGWGRTPSAWFPYCSQVAISGPMTRLGAQMAEIREIRRLHPAFNRQHNDTPQPWAPPCRHRAIEWSSVKFAWLDESPTERRTA